MHHHAPVRNAREAAEAGLELDQALLIKTLAYAMPGGWLLVALRALDRIDYAALAKAAGVDRRKLRFASDAELELPLVYFGSGRRDLTIETKPAALFAGVTHTAAVITK